MNDTELLDLLRRYTEGICTPEEISQVESGFNYVSDQGMPVADASPRQYEAARKRLSSKLGIHKPEVSYMPYFRYAAAVILIVGASYGSYFLLYNHKTSQTEIVKQDIQPGGNKAVLTLANGKVISLNANNGNVATLSNGGVLVTNSTSNGVVSFQIRNSKTEGLESKDSKSIKKYDNTNAQSSNNIRTPRGGQYQLLLPDGTRVFLNAASTLRFPSSFAVLKQRNVTLTGEAYFEVAKDPKKPFIVTTETQQVTVLGTHFNISAYEGETVRTTLEEGSVALLQPSSNLTETLKPNQQALLLSNGFKVKEFDASEAIAWKDGDFLFSKLPLRDALMQLSRWYDVEVNTTDLPSITLSGQFPKTFTLQQVLDAIKRGTGIKIQLTDGGLKFIR